ncbi:unnamed protein product [Amaranthus hypochondriacus]
METQNLTQRSTTTTRPDEPITANGGGDKRERQRRMVMARRGLKSLAVALSVPLILTLTNIYMFGANDNYKMSNRPNWVPPIWALHMACLGSTALLGLCGWMVWAEGGFHRNPNALGLFFGQFGLSLLWDPLVFKMGANWAGLVIAVGVCWALFRCYKVFRQVNEVAANLVLPCFGWAALLAFISLKFLLT